MSCNCCGMLYMDPAIVNGLDTLSDMFGKPEVLIGYTCPREAKRLYKMANPSSKYARPTFPMLRGAGAVVSWEFTQELAKLASHLGLSASRYEINSLLYGTLIERLPPASN